ncbi:pyridoxamine 5'-phosphate oxidase family protein [Streptacidiphilus monticola]|uniref:Pyridoxamine 5'-phosphate oxidase family protein n=1 Tax=Streptacidiphilus monticola TaxID=2161674 RepID=A0ABW1FTY1_9ACTN
MHITTPSTGPAHSSAGSAAQPSAASAGASSRVGELSREEAWRLLGSVSYGRVVFSHRALPAIRPVNHLVDDGCVVIRTHRGAALLGPAQDRAVVAYEADALDPVARSGWSVVVTGVATLVTDPEELRRYQEALQPWMGGEMEHVVRIRADLVTGYRLG